MALRDSALAVLLDAPTDASRDAALERLLLDARSISRKIIVRARGAIVPVEDLDDVVATIDLRLVRRLRRISAGEAEPIASFSDFVATVAYNTIYDFARCRFPQRVRLRNRLRYVLGRDPRLVLRNTEAGFVAGLSEWSDLTPRNPTNVPLELSHGATGDVLVELFETIGHPLLVDDVVDLVAASWGVADRPQYEERQPITDPNPTADVRIESHEQMEMLWREIGLLRVPQRAALLLNARDADGHNGLALLVLLGIATLDDIAAALEMLPEHLAAMWSDLPLDDLTIASMLGLTRQQVINLRKAARLRLGRRMALEERRG